MSREPWQVSNRMKEVWEWKEAIARKVAHLPIDEALDNILKKAAETGKNSPLPSVDPRISAKPIVIEKR